jgi:phage terminase Nu1 subunit (DNA packaging protein)
MAAQTYPVAVISKLLDLTPRRVQQLASEGVIPRAEKGRYELVPAVRGYIRYLRDRAIGAGVLPEDAARASRARLIKAQAEAQEMENEKVRGELLPLEIVGRAWAEMATSLPESFRRFLTASTSFPSQTGESSIAIPCLSYPVSLVEAPWRPGLRSDGASF